MAIILKGDIWNHIFYLKSVIIPGVATYLVWRPSLCGDLSCLATYLVWRPTLCGDLESCISCRTQPACSRFTEGQYKPNSITNLWVVLRKDVRWILWTYNFLDFQRMSVVVQLPVSPDAPWRVRAGSAPGTRSILGHFSLHGLRTDPTFQYSTTNSLSLYRNLHSMTPWTIHSGSTVKMALYTHYHC